MAREGTRSPPATLPGRPGAPVRRSWTLAPAWSAALRDSARDLLLSRLLIWVAGIGAILAFGRSRNAGTFDPAGLTAPYGALGDLLAGPAARWDSVWFIAIAQEGYVAAHHAAFFPLYPLLMRGAAFGSSHSGVLLAAGLAVSLVAMLVALVLLRRLAALELGDAAARTTVTLVAFFPMAFFLSAVYSESLYLALSVGAFWAARNERWALAGTVGALAATTRSAGLLLLVPLAILYLYGPRGERAARRHRLGPYKMRPRYRPSWNMLWLGLIPLGLAAFMAALALSGQDAFAPFRAQDVWMRELAGPFVAVWDGAVAAFDGARQLLSGSRFPVYFTPAGGDPFAAAGHNLVLFASLLLAIPMLVAALRRLPAAYGAYALCALALPLSFPVAAQPLMSLPRFLVVLFPLHMGLAAWASERGWSRWVVGLSALGLAAFAAQFAVWVWVA